MKPPSIMAACFNRRLLLGLVAAMMMSGCELSPLQNHSSFSRSNSSSPYYQSTTYNWADPASDTQSTAACVTWDKFKAAVQSGEVALNLPIPELPDGFKNGCVFADVDVHTLNMYILKEGIQSTVRLHADLAQLHPLYKFVPLPQDLNVLKLLDRGQALVVMFDSPDQIDRWFIQRNAWEQAYIDQENHTVMFRNVYMLSKSIPLEDLAKLLEATSNQWDAMPEG